MRRRTSWICISALAAVLVAACAAMVWVSRGIRTANDVDEYQRLLEAVERRRVVPAGARLSGSPRPRAPLLLIDSVEDRAVQDAIVDVVRDVRPGVTSHPVTVEFWTGPRRPVVDPRPGAAVVTTHDRSVLVRREVVE